MITSPPHWHRFLLGWSDESREVWNVHPSFQLSEGSPRDWFLSPLTWRANRHNIVWMTRGYRKKGRVGASFYSTRGAVVLQTETRATRCDKEKACNWVASLQKEDESRTRVWCSDYAKSCSMAWYLSHSTWGASSELAYFGHLGRAQEVREQRRSGLACCYSTKELATLQTDPTGAPEKEIGQPL